MTKLSVNINKVATLRNARGENNPNVLNVALACEKFGADGITVHPRPDGRHIRYQDVFDLSHSVKTELNIEGYPSLQFIDLVLKTRPVQVTLVPDAPDAITSNTGWDVKKSFDLLSEIVEGLKEKGIRTSIFVDTDLHNIELAAKTGADRIELYTEPYARLYKTGKENAAAPFVKAAEMGKKVGLGINAGHDLNLENLEYLHHKIPYLDEVSIGHALVCDALYLGLETTIQKYKQQLK
jgi:pyridoxine 5-phosphate synthase